MKLIYEKNKACVKLTIKKEKLKEKALNINTKYKKFMEDFINKNYNDTFGAMSLMTYFLLMKSVLKANNENIDNEIVITHDDKNYYIRVILLRFYDRDLNNSTTEQLEFLIENKFDENEKDVLNAYLNLIPDEETMEKGLGPFLNVTLNSDSYLHDYKARASKAKEEGTELKENVKGIILKRLFSSYYLYVLKDSFGKDKNNLEENYG